MLGDPLKQSSLHFLKREKNGSLIEVHIYLLFCSLALIYNRPDHFFEKFIKCEEVIALGYQKSSWQLIFLFIKDLGQSGLILGHYRSENFKHFKR